MMLIIPAQKVDLRGLPNWFVWVYTVIYVALFSFMIGFAGYASWLLFTAVLNA